MNQAPGGWPETTEELDRAQAAKRMRRRRRTVLSRRRLVPPREGEPPFVATVPRSAGFPPAPFVVAARPAASERVGCWSRDGRGRAGKGRRGVGEVLVALVYLCGWLLLILLLRRPGRWTTAPARVRRGSTAVEGLAIRLGDLSWIAGTVRPNK